MANSTADKDTFTRIIGSTQFALFLYSAAFCFMALIMVPLYQLVESRIALMIVFSKAIGTIFMTAFQCAFYAFGINNCGIFWSNLERLTNLFFVTLRLHILSMAINRFHSIFWPFHYNRTMTRKLLMKLCIGIWIISFVLAALHTYLDITDPMKGDNYVPNLASNLFTLINQISIYGSVALYICILAKMVWLKVIIHAWNANTFEKDALKMCLMCFTSLTPFLMGALPAYFQFNSSMAAFFKILKLLGDTFGYCAEEICLIAIHEDFRQKIKLQFKAIFGHMVGKNISTQMKNNRVHENAVVTASPIYSLQRLQMKYN